MEKKFEDTIRNMQGKLYSVLIKNGIKREHIFNEPLYKERQEVFNSVANIKGERVKQNA